MGNPVPKASLLGCCLNHHRSLVHGGGGAQRRYAAAVGKACRSAAALMDQLSCRQACGLTRRSDSPFNATVCALCSSRSMIASAMVGSLSH